MPKINILDKQTINQIAAGEVIERPASVVKELLENSIDAGATAVTVEIGGGGINLIRITDNGCGIENEQVRTAFLRHATSKLSDASELAGVRSLGFRGEALASIAAVADVELITKTRDSFSGTRYRISGGEELANEEIGCPDGTTFVVRELFANVPVRRKFLKSAVTEAGYVNELVERIALAHPEVSIKYIANGRNAIFTTGVGSVKNVIYGIYGREITGQLLPVEYSESEINVTGFIARPTVARGNRNLEYYCVNGRFIRNNTISKAIEDAYQPYLMQHKYPFTVIHLDIPSSIMDVNVHPTKQEVRFEDPQVIYQVVYHAVKKTLSEKSLVPQMEPSEKPAATGIMQKPVTDVSCEKKESIPLCSHISEEPKAVRPAYEINKAHELSEVKEISEAAQSSEAKEFSEAAQSNEAKEISAVVEKKEVKEIGEASESSIANESGEAEEIGETGIISESKSVYSVASTDYTTDTPLPEPFETERRKVFVKDYTQLAFDTMAEDLGSVHEETKEEFKNGLSDGYRIVGQVFNTYWIVEKAKDMFIIDQHAAHEKVIYERMMKSFAEGKPDIQYISPARIISFSASEASVVAQNESELEKMGFMLTNYGGREYALSGSPMQLYGLDPELVLHEIVESLSTTSTQRKDASLSVKERIATCSCKAAVKGNNRLSYEEAHALIEELLKLDNPFNCPHGRPVIISMTQNELEKKFKRIV